MATQGDKEESVVAHAPPMSYTPYYLKGVDMVLKGASVIYLVQVTMFELYYLPS